MSENFYSPFNVLGSLGRIEKTSPLWIQPHFQTLDEYLWLTPWCPYIQTLSPRGKGVRRVTADPSLCFPSSLVKGSRKLIATKTLTGSLFSITHKELPLPVCQHLDSWQHRGGAAVDSPICCTGACRGVRDSELLLPVEYAAVHTHTHTASLPLPGMSHTTLLFSVFTAVLSLIQWAIFFHSLDHLLEFQKRPFLISGERNWWASLCLCMCVCGGG